MKAKRKLHEEAFSPNEKGEFEKNMILTGQRWIKERSA